MLGTGWISPDRQRFEGFAWLDGPVRVAGTASTG